MDEKADEVRSQSPEAEIVDEIAGVERRNEDVEGTDIRSSRTSRKRTKTGCLTCRKRRIKCGEERPTCGNCIKSKRQCEGYNQRVIFKNPLSVWRGPVPSSSSHSTFAPGRVFEPMAAPLSEQAQVQVHSSLQTIAPKPMNCDEHSAARYLQPCADFGPTRSEVHHGSYKTKGNEGLSDGVDAISNVTTKKSYPPYATIADEGSYLQISEPQEAPHNIIQPMPGPCYQLEALANAGSVPSSSTEKSQGVHSTATVQTLGKKEPLKEHDGPSECCDLTSGPFLGFCEGSHNWPLRLPSNDPSHPVHLHGAEHQTIQNDKSLRLNHEVSRESALHIVHHTSRDDNRNCRATIPPYSDQQRPDVRLDREPIQPVQNSSALQEGLFRSHEDDMRSGHYYQRPELPVVDAFLDDSDVEMNYEEYDHDPHIERGEVQQSHLENNDLGIVVALQSKQDSQDLRLRTYHSVIDSYGPDMLTNYHPSPQSSPLRDSTTARIFCHFINVTGPAISMYERHPANPSLMFQGRPISRSQQHIWAYTFPTLALGHQALLHAMLALSSLHISKLQPNIPIAPSLKHYHIALRRMARSVSLPTRRGQPATLAASLLLGFYEVWSAEHQKWSNHLLGSNHLIKGIDFEGMTKFIKRRRFAEASSPEKEYSLNQEIVFADTAYQQRQNLHADYLLEDDADDNIVGMIMGRQIQYDQHGEKIDDNDASSSQEKVYTSRDLEMYENQRDLFWWYCKQDAYQSILSGNRLFLDYELWSQCPPRAPLGRRDAIYGTFDHMTLLLGRVAEFAAKDLKRKREALKAGGGQWRPPVETEKSANGGPTGQDEAATQSNSLERGSELSSSKSVPMFAGMIPGVEGKPTLPRGFSPSRDASPESEHEETNLGTRTREAEDEWNEIIGAFKLLEDNFGPDFQALGTDHAQPIQSPFGPALQYRTYSIAGIWIGFYLALIVLHRAHPSMPPATMVAAGLAARQTSFYANEIGRAIAGIASPNISSLTAVNTQVGAGLIESTFGLFVAAVQYRDAAQREWTIGRLIDINRLTGWETAIAIANGCETSWIKSAEMRRGPPYTRVTDRERSHPSMWYSGTRRVDLALLNRDDEKQKLAVSKQEKVQFVLGLLGVAEDLDQLELAE